MQITIAITLPYHQFKEWSKENVKTRTTRSRTREGNSIRDISIRSQCSYILVKRFCDEFHLCRVVSDTNAWHSLDKRFAVLEIKPMEKRRNEKSDDTKQIEKRNKVLCASAFCKSGVGIL
ncbi:hypothetical protein T01_15092 [Trichinella spiralis]|uniref:Uncharacterized protein n=1 Tax=Trichinella spiralis TaxID=6334 RepID=A0A0V1BJN0_TRISP|nr:hypothetical protein T01_15092 [Trichinella spiralis]